MKVKGVVEVKDISDLQVEKDTATPPGKVSLSLAPRAMESASRLPCTLVQAVSVAREAENFAVIMSELMSAARDRETAFVLGEIEMVAIAVPSAGTLTGGEVSVIAMTVVAPGMATPDDPVAPGVVTPGVETPGVVEPDGSFAPGRAGTEEVTKFSEGRESPPKEAPGRSPEKMREEP